MSNKSKYLTALTDLRQSGIADMLPDFAMRGRMRRGFDPRSWHPGAPRGFVTDVRKATLMSDSMKDAGDPTDENEGAAPFTNAEDISGMAALSICEALLLALNDAKVLPELEIIGVLRDAAATHEHANGSAAQIARHKAAALLIQRIIAGGNSVRHP